MERLTEIRDLSEKILNHWALTDTKQLGLQACEIATELAIKLAAYKDAEEQGRLVMLPHKTIFRIFPIDCDKCKKANGQAMCESGIEFYEKSNVHDAMKNFKKFHYANCPLEIEEIEATPERIELAAKKGNEHFLTREAAEAALKELNHE